MLRSAPSTFRPIELSDAFAPERRERWLAMLATADWARIRALSRPVDEAYAPGPLAALTARCGSSAARLDRGADTQAR